MKKIFTLKTKNDYNIKTLHLSDINLVLKRITFEEYKIEVINYIETIKNRLLSYKEKVGDIDFSSLDNKAAYFVINSNNELLDFEIFDNLDNITNCIYAINALKGTNYFRHFCLSSPYYGTIYNNVAFSSTRLSYAGLSKATGISLPGLMSFFPKGGRYRALIDILTFIDVDFIQKFFNQYDSNKKGVKSLQEIEEVKKIIEENT